MPTPKSTSQSTSSPKSRKKRSRTPTKFIPNLKQLTDAAAELPDPDLWPAKSYQCPIEVDGKQHIIDFALKPINRGKEKTPRWTYEGRILIRKRDA